MLNIEECEQLSEDQKAIIYDVGSCTKQDLKSIDSE